MRSISRQSAVKMPANAWLSVHCRLTSSLGGLNSMPFRAGRHKTPACDQEQPRSVRGKLTLTESPLASEGCNLKNADRSLSSGVSSFRQPMQVQFLDRTEHTFMVDKKALGQELLNRVFDYLDLREPSYFGLVYCENESCPGSARWLDGKKVLRKQLKGSTRLYFRVKFFANNPETLLDEFTRYLYVTHLRREILFGNIYVSRDDAVKLAALLMQADYGDFNGSCIMNKDEAIKTVFLPMQSSDFLSDVRLEHTRLVGCTPASADLKYLEIAKNLEMYGVEIHHATVSVRESTDLGIKVGVCSSGIVIFQGFQKITNFTWQITIFRCAFCYFRVLFRSPAICVAERIAALTLEVLGRRQMATFVIRIAEVLLSPLKVSMQNGKDDLLVSLMLPSYQSSKALWKSCVDHHAFFRSSPSTISVASASQKAAVVMGGLNELYRGIRGDHRSRIDKSDHNTSSIRSSTRHNVQMCTPSINLRKRFKTPTCSDNSCYSSSFIVNERRRRPNLNCVRTEPTYNSCLLSNSGKCRQLSPESNRFPSPTPSKTSVYSVLAPTANLDLSSDSKAALLIEPYQAVLHESLTQDNSNCDINRLSTSQFQHRFGSRRNVKPSSLQSIANPDLDFTDRIFCPSDRLVSCPSRISNVNDNASSDTNLQSSMQALRSDLQTSVILTCFDKLYRSQPGFTFEHSRKHDNYYKNRYKDVLPYDQTRVCLNKGVDGDYINANHINIPINSVDVVNKYIATQGPLPTTTDDFWQMVWEQDVFQVVMLTTLNENGRIKCHKYWPDSGECTDYGRFQIRGLKETRSADNHNVHRELLFKRNDLNEERIIHHAQCESWPDHGVPSDYTSFVDFVQWIRAGRRDSPSSPVLVHCSAGIGRTGVIILAETALCLIDQNIPVYPIDIVKQMRNQRYSMIQTRQQFQFACEAILHAYRRQPNHQ